MTRRPLRALPALLLACSASSSPPAATPDASADATADAPRDTGSGFPIDEAGAVDAADAGSECDQLRAQANALGLAARACNPQGSGQCNAGADGICCQITVSIASTQAVNDFQHAVDQYKSKCTVDCSMVLCDPTAVPSGVCDGTGSTGICR